jgi:hypothetical protein
MPRILAPPSLSFAAAATTDSHCHTAQLRDAGSLQNNFGASHLVAIARRSWDIKPLDSARANRSPTVAFRLAIMVIEGSYRKGERERKGTERKV